MKMNSSRAGVIKIGNMSNLPLFFLLPHSIHVETIISLSTLKVESLWSILENEGEYFIQDELSYPSS